MIYLAHAHPRTGRGSVSKYRKKLNLGLTAGPVDHVVVPPIDGFHADAVLAQRDDHHSLGEIPSGPRAIVPEPHTNILRPRLSSGTEVIARLFGGTASATRRPPTRRSRAPPERAAGVPDPVFWKVMEFWQLGEDWRRPGILPKNW